MHTDDGDLNYLGIPYLTRQQMGPEIAERIKCARQWCQRHWDLLCSPILNSRPKFHLYKTFVRPILTYGCEVWNLSHCECKKLLRFETGILMEIYKSKYPLRHPKRLKPDLAAVYRRFRGSDVIDHVNCERLRWTELLQSEENSLRKSRKRGIRSVHWWDKPCKTYNKCVRIASRSNSRTRQSTSKTKESNEPNKSPGEGPDPNPSTSKTKDNKPQSPDANQPSTSKEHNASDNNKTDNDPG